MTAVPIGTRHNTYLALLTDSPRLAVWNPTPSLEPMIYPVRGLLYLEPYIFIRRWYQSIADGFALTGSRIRTITCAGAGGVGIRRVCGIV